MEDRHTLDANVILRRVSDGIEEGGIEHSYTYLVVRMRADGRHGDEVVKVRISCPFRSTPET